MNRREALRLLAYTGVAITNIGAISSFFSSCAKRQLTRQSIDPDRYGVTLLVDGWRADLFKEMLDSGSLPNIKKHLVDRGTTVDTCVSTFPSTTGPAHLPFITGAMPGHNDCPGLRWIDRYDRCLRDYCTIKNVMFNSDFPDSNYTLYEMLYGERTTCIFDFVSRGASEVINVPAKTLWYMLTGNMEIWNKMDAYAVDAFRETYIGSGITPRYSFVWMPAIDHIAHFHGSRDKLIIDRAINVDKLVGTMMRTLRQAGLYDKTLVSLVVDHGMSDTERHVDLRGILQRADLKVLEDLTSNDQFNSLYQNNAARGVSGNSFSLLYFATRRKGRLSTMSYAWDEPMTYEQLRHFPASSGTRVDLLELLRKENGINLVIAKEKEDTFVIFSRHGLGRIERDFASLRYSFTDVDPLGYADNADSEALIDGAYHDKDDWFLASRNTNYPDGLFQIAQLFDSSKCGDIVVTALPGWDLMDQGHIASHGSLEKNQLQVPCIIAGPEMKQGTIPIARTVDLYPAYLKHFGIIPRHDVEVLDVFG